MARKKVPVEHEHVWMGMVGQRVCFGCARNGVLVEEPVEEVKE